MSSLSSDSEEGKRLLESIDVDFVPRSQHNDAELKTKRPSKRKSRDDNQHLESNSSFCKYLSGRLDNILSRKFKEVDCTSKHLTLPSVSHEGGIRMFSSSKEVIEFALNFSPAKKKRSNNIHLESDSSEEEQECRKFEEAVVTSEWVLKRKGVFEETTAELGKIVYR